MQINLITQAKWDIPADNENDQLYMKIKLLESNYRTDLAFYGNTCPR